MSMVDVESFRKMVSTTKKVFKALNEEKGGVYDIFNRRRDNFRLVKPQEISFLKWNKGTEVKED